MRAKLLTIVTLFIFSCTNTTKIPKDILSKQKMQGVLWDIILAERFSSLFLLKDSLNKNIKVENFKLYQQVFHIHKISKEDFIKSYKYYLSRPELSKVIFDSIAVKAERERATIYKSDSIK